MKYYAVIDTNVLVSAMLRWSSIPGNVMQFTLNGTIIPLLHHDIINEYRNVLMRPKFHFTEEIVNDIIDDIQKRGIYIDSKELDIDLIDPKDKIFYEVVMEERKSEFAYLVTGNIKHFPKQPYIVTPREMIDIIISNE